MEFWDIVKSAVPIVALIVALIGLWIAVAKYKAEKLEKEEERRQKEAANEEIARQARIARLENAHNVQITYDSVNVYVRIYNHSPRLIRNVELVESGDVTGRIDIINGGRRGVLKPEYIYTHPSDPLAGKEICWLDYEDKTWTLKLDNIWTR